MDTQKSKSSVTDEELSRMAVEQILQETRIASVRAEIAGPSGWQPHKNYVNKNFLNNTLLANAQFNERKKTREAS